MTFIRGTGCPVGLPSPRGWVAQLASRPSLPVQLVRFGSVCGGRLGGCSHCATSCRWGIFPPHAPGPFWTALWLPTIAILAYKSPQLGFLSTNAPVCAAVIRPQM